MGRRRKSKREKTWKQKIYSTFLSKEARKRMKEKKKDKQEAKAAYGRAYQEEYVDAMRDKARRDAREKAEKGNAVINFMRGLGEVGGNVNYNLEQSSRRRKKRKGYDDRINDYYEIY